MDRLKGEFGIGQWSLKILGQGWVFGFDRIRILTVLTVAFSSFIFVFIFILIFNV